jgi:vitamin B12/bleomycin/antimicrobial peptide transport system ATP-binding/permease protein
MLVMVAVCISILLNYSNDLYSALQVAFEGAASGKVRVRDSGIHGFWVAIGIFAIIWVIYIARHGRSVPDAAIHHPVARLADTTIDE